jgi:hypothetical protein
MKNTGKNRVIAGISGLLFFKAPFYLLYAFTFCFVICVFRLPGGESLNLLNFSFPVVGILAGIAFSWAQCLPEGAQKERALIASKRFFHSLVLLCLGIICKYISFANIPGMAVPRPVLFIMGILVYYAIGVALAFFYAGLHATSKNLWRNADQSGCTRPQSPFTLFSRERSHEGKGRR